VEEFREQITGTGTRNNMAKMSFTPIVPKGKIIDEKAIMDEIEKTLRNVTGKKLQIDFKKTVRTWNNKPSFKKVFAKLPNQMVEKVFPTGSNRDQYYYVHEGTRARLIVPRPGNRALKFQAGYIAATKKGGVSSKHASRHGDTVFATKVTRYKGIEARKFSAAIAKKNQRQFEADIQEAINRVVD